MGELFSIFTVAVLVQNIVLIGFLGICPLLGVSKKTNSALGMGLATSFVLIVSSILSWAIYHLVLVPFDLTFMRTIVFITFNATLVQFVEMVIKKYIPSLYRSLGVFLPLITTNCVIIGVALLNISREYTFIESTIHAIGAAVGFTIVIYIFSVMRVRLEHSNVPSGFKGVPVALIVVALMSMAFLGFAGI